MKTHAGFTLIEVLIAVVILAGGLLGLAALQATTLKNNQGAYFRSVATQLAYDMSDRMRSNSAGVIALDYNNKTASTTPRDCIVNRCTPAQMADYDLAQWNTALGELPGGFGVVCRDSSPEDGVDELTPECSNTGSDYAIKVWWEDDMADPNGDGTTIKRFVMSFQP
jgi:type IV pilus assembly protein PilV